MNIDEATEEAACRSRVVYMSLNHNVPIHNGHVVVFKNGQWFHKNGTPVSWNDGCKGCGWKRRRNPETATLSTPPEPDGCTGMLGYVSSFCCGHGIPGEGYIIFDNGTRIQITVHKVHKRYFDPKSPKIHCCDIPAIQDVAEVK